MAKPPRLSLVDRLDLPVPEASGVVVAQRTDGDRLVVVGDRSSVVAVATVRDGRPVDWETIDLTAVTGWPSPSGDSQLEAVACDAGSMVVLMREDPAEVLVVDSAHRRLRARISLVVPSGSALAGKWDDASSRGEGLVLLRGGRLLVAKEKRPRALVEFGPASSSPGGLSSDDLVAADEEWSAPEADVTFHALAVWKLRGSAKKALRDISDIGVGRDRSLWLLSDKSAAVARLDLSAGLPSHGGVISSLDPIYALPPGTPKPEGFAMVDYRTLLVALDTDKARRNAILVRRSTPDGSD